MKYSDFNLSTTKNTVTAKIGNFQFEVLIYLPVQDKIDLIEIALQRAEENGIYNEMKLAMYFNLYLVYMYTDIEFTDEQKADEYKLYDELESNGIIMATIEFCDEYDTLLHYLEIMKENKIKYKNSAAGILSTFIQDMPRNAEAMSEIVDNFDPIKYKEVVDFAKYANAGRSI